MNVLKGSDSNFLLHFNRGMTTAISRVKNPLYAFDIFWKQSKLYSEHSRIMKPIENFVHNVSLLRNYAPQSYSLTFLYH